MLEDAWKSGVDAGLPLSLGRFHRHLPCELQHPRWASPALSDLRSIMMPVQKDVAEVGFCSLAMDAEIAAQG